MASERTFDNDEIFCSKRCETFETLSGELTANMATPSNFHHDGDQLGIRIYRHQGTFWSNNALHLPVNPSRSKVGLAKCAEVNISIEQRWKPDEAVMKLIVRVAY